VKGDSRQKTADNGQRVNVGDNGITKGAYPFPRGEGAGVGGEGGPWMKKGRAVSH